MYKRPRPWSVVPDGDHELPTARKLWAVLGEPRKILPAEGEGWEQDAIAIFARRSDALSFARLKRGDG